MSIFKYQLMRREKWGFPSRSGVLQVAIRFVIYASVSALMLLFFYNLEDRGRQSYLQDLALQATVDLNESNNKIEHDIYKHVLELAKFATLIGQSPTLDHAEFDARALEYLQSNPGAESVTYAPDMVAKMVFPLLGNESIIGLDYKVDQKQYSKLSEQLSIGEGLITTVVDAVPGDQGLTLRQPVIVTDVNGINQIVGIVSVSLNCEAFLAATGISEFEQTYEILIREKHSTRADPSGVLYGNVALLDRDPIRFGLNFPSGDWELALAPVGGWPKHQPNSQRRWLQHYGLIVTSMVFMWCLFRAYDARQAAEQKLFTGIEALDHGFVMFDSDRRLIAFNKKYKQLAGGSGMVRIGSRYEDIVKANLANGLIPDAIGWEEEWYEKWSKRLEMRSSDNEQILADGRMIRAYDRPMDDGSVVGLRIDITDLKEAQLAAEAANQAKTDFLGVLSHELRTPLTVILGNAKLAAHISRMPVYQDLVGEIERLPGGGTHILPKLERVNQQICKMMESLENSGSHLFDLISEVLDFAKIESGTVSLDLERTNSARIANPVVDQLRSVVEGKGLTFISKVENCDLTADIKRVQQVLINLISNASKFTEKGSVTLTVTQKDQDVVLSVRDTGIGIPADHIDRVFGAFEQVDSALDKKFGGTGLGLAISRDLAEAHGGEITVVSTVGQGSTFTLTLPRQQADMIFEQPEECLPEAKALVA